MDIVTVLYYGNQTVLKTLDGLDFAHWETGGVCGHWSVKDIIAHLAIEEQILLESLQALNGQSETPTLTAMLNSEKFNDTAVAAYQKHSPEAVFAEYQNLYEQTTALLKTLPTEKLRQKGLIAWYGAEYDLEDMLVYAFYAHKREHCAQINVFRDTLK